MKSFDLRSRLFSILNYFNISIIWNPEERGCAKVGPARFREFPKKESGMRISARNQLKGVVKSVQEGAVNGVVTIGLGDDDQVKADITMEAIRDLGLTEGKEAWAIIKASSVMFAPAKIEGISARNQLCGKITKVEEGAVNGHVAIELKNGDKVKGSITNEAIEQLGLKEGGEAVAIVKATEVMVGVE